MSARFLHFRPLLAAGLLSFGSVGSAASESNPPVPTPYLQLRNTSLAYHGPEPDLTGLAEIRIGWFGPADYTNTTAADMWCAANLALHDANSTPSNAPPNSQILNPNSQILNPNSQLLPLRLIPRWSADPWGSGVAQLARMVFVDQPVALLGSVDSPSTHLAEQIAAKANLPLVSPVTTDPSVTLAGVSWMFCCAPSDDAIARVLVDDILAGPSGKSEIRNPKSEISRPLALLAGTDHESRMTARAVLRELNRRHRPPDFRFDVPPGPGTLDTHWTALAAAAPSAVLIIAGPDDAARLLRAARTRLPASRPCQFYGTHVMARTRFRELAGDAAKGVRFPVLAAPDPRHPATAQFMRRFTAQRQHLPDDTAVLTYDATCLLLEAIRKAGPSRAAVRETLAHSGPWHGLGGIIQFDGTGQNTRTNITMAALHEPGSLGRRLSPQPFVAGATKGCGRFMVPRRASRSVESLHEPTVAGRARHSVRAAAGCNVDCIRGAQGTARPTVGQRFMVFMRDNCFAINPLPQPAIRNAGFIRQNRAADRTLPDESSVLHTPRFGTPTDDLPFGVSTFPLGGLVPAPFRESRPEPNVGQPHTS